MFKYEEKLQHAHSSKGFMETPMAQTLTFGALDNDYTYVMVYNFGKLLYSCLLDIE